jgi:hypothetical protein
MSMHETLVRLATIDDDDTAKVLAVALNADQEIRRIAAGGAAAPFTAEDIKRVARALADHVGVNRLAPHVAARQAVAAALEDQPEFDLTRQ